MCSNTSSSNTTFINSGWTVHTGAEGLDLYQHTSCICSLTTQTLRNSFLAWTGCSQQPMFYESHSEDQTAFPMCEAGLQQSQVQLLHILIVPRLARVVKPGPGSRPPPLWSTQPGSLQKRLSCQLLYPSYRTPRAGKARLTVPRCLRSLRLISPSSRPPSLSAFQSSKQLEGDPFLLSSTHGKKKGKRMRKKEEGGPSCWWWWSSGLARTHLWSSGY